MTEILKSRPVVDKNLESLKKEVKSLKTKGVTPYLKVILVGDNPASVLYTNNKKKLIESIGGKCDIIKLDKDTDENSFLEIVAQINDDKLVHGGLIQLPLPTQLKHLDVTTLINSSKDVDGFHPDNVFKLYKGESEDKVLAPCTPKGIITLCKYYGIELTGKKITVIGRSLIVGKPLSLILTNHNATVTLCHSRTSNIKEVTKNSDIIITALGQYNFLRKEHLNESANQVIIDVGMNKDPDGKTVGDCNFNELLPHVSAITPVPGGVGPMTVFTLAQNLLQATKNSLYL